MKLFLFILLAGCAVCSDDNNYYVIDVPPSNTNIRTGKPFKVYWNVPTMQCASKKIRFENLYEKFGIIQNDDDRFKGEKITILYDPGLFPALFKNETGGNLRFRNGGVPQEGDLNKHLEEFKKELDKSIPDEKFSGIAIIDFESWRPIYRQNFGALQPYKDVSVEIERKLHWWWQKKWLEEEAKRRFEEAGRTFMEGTLTVAKKLRPNARWGFYGFPYCFNMANNNKVESCAKNVPQENDEISWLWSGSTALYPSVYSSATLSTSQLVSLIRGRIREAARCANNNSKDILPYFWFRYRDDGFLSERDLAKALSTLYESRATGIIIWGSSSDVNTVDKCTKLLEYVQNTFGPAIAKYTKSIMRDTEENETDNKINTDITENPLHPVTLKVEEFIDPEFHWSPPENYTQDLIKVVEEQINKKFGQNNADNSTDVQNNNVLIDLILNAVLNNENNASAASTEAPITKYDKKTNLNELASTTKINDKTSTGSNQVTNIVVTKDPLISENETSTRLEQQAEEVITNENVLSENVITEKAVRETQATDNASIDSKHEIDITDSNISVSESTVTTTVINNSEPGTEIDYEDIDTEDDNFFNIDTLITLLNSAKTYEIEDTTNSINTDISKSEKKEQTNTNIIYDWNLDENTTEKSTTDTQITDEIDILRFIKTDSYLESDENLPSGSVEYTTELNNILINTTEKAIPKGTNTNIVTEIQSVKTTTDEIKRLVGSNTYSKESELKHNEYTSPTTENNILISSEFAHVFTSRETEMSESTEPETTEETSTFIVPTEQVIVF